MSNRRLSDAELMRSSIAHPHAFEEIYHRHHTRIYTYLARRVGTDDAVDLASEAFTIAFRKRDEFAAADAAPWLFGIARNLARTRARSLGRERRAYARLDRAHSSFPGDDEDAARLNANGRMTAIQRALRQLRHRDREIFLLLSLGELTYAEIAEAMGTPIGTVRSSLSRTRKRLTTLIGEDAEDPDTSIGTREVS